MTRESIPRFDLYAELEVSRLASVEVIEAVYRTLAKRHHPDVARPHDADRIKRLTLARAWLTDPVKRARYDAAGGPATPAASIGNGAREPSPRAFGPNTIEVRQFLADMRALDSARAIEIHGAMSAADPVDYAAARHLAVTEARAQREAEWLLAREAASVIARGKLGGSPLTSEVSNVVADIAGAIAIRDLLPRAEYDVLLQPWTRRGDPWAGVQPVAGVQPAIPARSVGSSQGTAVSAPVPVAATMSRVRRPRRVRSGSSLPTAPVAIIGMVALIALGSVMLGVNRPKPDLELAGLTDAPTSSGLPALTGTPSPLASSPAVAVASPGTADPPSPSFAPSVTSGPAGTTKPARTTAPVTLGPTSTPVPPSSPSPSGAPTDTPAPSLAPTDTPVPTLAPTDTPAPSLAPTDTPTPTLSPEPMCMVPDFFNDWSYTAWSTWADAGFSGTVIHIPAWWPPYRITWQSEAAGTSVACASGITVRRDAP